MLIIKLGEPLHLAVSRGHIRNLKASVCCDLVASISAHRVILALHRFEKVISKVLTQHIPPPEDDDDHAESTAGF